MTAQSPRKSYAQVLAILGAVFALSGMSAPLVDVELTRNDEKVLEVTATPAQAADIEFDHEIHADGLDEKTKDLIEEMLDNVAVSYEQEVELRVQSLTALMEPVLIIAMGGAVVPL